MGDYFYILSISLLLCFYVNGVKRSETLFGYSISVFGIFSLIISLGFYYPLGGKGALLFVGFVTLSFITLVVILACYLFLNSKSFADILVSLLLFSASLFSTIKVFQHDW